MRLGWQFLVPLSIVNVMMIGVALALHRQLGWPNWVSFPLGILLTLAAGAYLLATGEKHTQIRVGEDENAEVDTREETPVNV
jgi:membrane protein YdbS with pleckstrin-like domain